MINWIGEVGERSKVAESRTGPPEQRARSVIGPTAGATTQFVRLAARLLIDAVLAASRNKT